MKAGIDELLEQVTERTKQHLVALFAASPMHELVPGKLVELGAPLSIGDRGNRYQLSVFPAITKVVPIRGKEAVSAVFARFAPTGELRQRRDDEEEDRKPGLPNRACTEMAYELSSSSPAVQNVLNRLRERFHVTWPDIELVHLITVTNSDLDLVFVLVARKDLEALARDVATT